MKKLFTILFATMLIGQAWADANYDFSAVCGSGQTLYYKIKDDAVLVTYPNNNRIDGVLHLNLLYDNYSAPTGNLIIPETVIFEGVTYSVISIDKYAFAHCSGLTSVVIPNTVRNIGKAAFMRCTGLTSISLPFVGDKRQEPTDNNTMFKYIFSYTSSDVVPTALKIVTITGSSYIPSSAFAYCSGLVSITIGDSVKSIGHNAFKGCSGLVSITIGDSVTSIGNSAFSGCSGLTSVTIPKSVTSIGGSAFESCSGLTSVTIPNSVTSIGTYAFSGCRELASITIPDSVTSIGDGTFRGCSGLSSITIPDSVTYIGEEAFLGCNGLTSITIPNSVNIIGKSAFSDCKGLTSVTIPNSVSNIGEEAFLGCNGLTSITIPNSVNIIGKSAFSDCKGLTSVTIPNSVSNIGEKAFLGCDSIETLTYNTNAIHSLFKSMPSIKKLNIGNSVTNIDYEAFLGCTGLTTVCIPDSVTSIGNSAFSGCSGLTSVTIPKSVTRIGGSAFESCSGLTSIVIPNTVTNIGASAFRDCVNLTIYCQAKVKHSGWNDKWNISENPVVWGAQLANVEVTTNNSIYGQVSGMGAYIDGSQATILAIANAGYVFVEWNDGNTENPRSIIANGYLNFTAIFEKTNEPEGGNENQGWNNEGGENTTPSTAVSESAANAINIYAHGNAIIVENATAEIRVYDAMGRLIVRRDDVYIVSTEIRINTAGLYIVKVGNVAKRVMVND